MRDQLPQRVKANESAVVNLDSSENPGTHWTAYVKKGNVVHFYDSFGVEPCSELLEYWGKRCLVLANSTQDQEIDQVICGHLCLKFINNYGRE